MNTKLAPRHLPGDTVFVVFSQVDETRVDCAACGGVGAIEAFAGDGRALGPKLCDATGCDDGAITTTGPARFGIATSTVISAGVEVREFLDSDLTVRRGQPSSETVARHRAGAAPTASGHWEIVETDAGPLDVRFRYVGTMLKRDKMVDGGDSVELHGNSYYGNRTFGVREDAAQCARFLQAKADLEAARHDTETNA